MSFGYQVLGFGAFPSRGATAYVISQSARFNPADSPTTTHTYNAAGSSDKIATLSWWMKLGNLGIARILFDFDSGQETVNLHTNNKMRITYASVEALITTQVFRDPTAWYHCVWRIDTTNSTAGDRLRLYVNGSEVTVFDTDSNPSVNTVMGGMGINGEVATVGSTQAVASEFDGYLAEVAMCDGQSLGPDSFGETDDQGNWVPIDLSGLTFGNNGFWLDFADSSDFGSDVSGNSNDFSDSGLATNDQVTDSPTDDAANDVGNFGVWSPINGLGWTLSNGNQVATGTTNERNQASTIWVDSADTDGFYWEFDVTSVGNEQMLGLATTDFVNTGSWTTSDVVGYRKSGEKADGRNASSAAHGDAFVGGETVGICIKAGNLYFRNEGVWQNSSDPDAETGAAYTDITGFVCPALVNSSPTGTNTIGLNTGQTAYANTEPTGTKKLVTFDITAPAITDPSKYFQVNTHTGTGAEQVITLTDGAGVAVSPDFVWIKDRDGAVEHAMTDVVRGATKEQSLNDNAIDETVAQGLKSFDASGFTLGTDASYNSSGPYSSWSWVEGSTPGFDVLTYTGNATIRNISHNAGLAPGMMLFKDTTSSSDIQTWRMYHNGSHPTTPELRYEQPLSTAATAGSGTEWNSTAPTSSVFTLGTNDIINKNGETFVAYLWSEVEGYCKISQFEGNGAADGTFVYCGFRPAWIMLKSVDSTSSWFYYDSKRDGYNPVNDHFLFTTSAEVTATHLDILSNGFKLRIATVDPNVAETYLFTAFAEFPFGGDGVSQARAR